MTGTVQAEQPVVPEAPPGEALPLTTATPAPVLAWIIMAWVMSWRSHILRPWTIITNGLVMSGHWLRARWRQFSRGGVRELAARSDLTTSSYTTGRLVRLDEKKPLRSTSKQSPGSRRIRGVSSRGGMKALICC